jgi:hypothetical protein
MEFPTEPLIQSAIGGFMLNMMNLYQESKKTESRPSSKR